MNIGEFNDLTLLRFTSVGAYLGDEQDNDVLLPNKYLNDEMEIGDILSVFIYRDSEDRIVATTEIPLIKLNGFAFLRVKEVNFYGAFLDWGLEKDLMVPFKEQNQKMEENNYYLVTLRMDDATERLYASMKVNKYFTPCTDTSLLDQPSNLLIGDKTDLGQKVIVDDQYQGIIYSNDISKPIRRGDYAQGFIYNIREDGKVDVRLEPTGFVKFDEAAQKILDILKEQKVLNLSDKSSPDDIREQVGMSKKTFKQAIGKLYKERLISINESSVVLN